MTLDISSAHLSVPAYRFMECLPPATLMRPGRKILTIEKWKLWLNCGRRRVDGEFLFVMASRIDGES